MSISRHLREMTRDVVDDGGVDAPVLEMHPCNGHLSLLDATCEGREQDIVGPVGKGRGEARRRGRRTRMIRNRSRIVCSEEYRRAVQCGAVGWDEVWWDHACDSMWTTYGSMVRISSPVYVVSSMHPLHIGLQTPLHVGVVHWTVLAPLHAVRLN